jgi:TonB family protein
MTFKTRLTIRLVLLGTLACLAIGKRAFGQTEPAAPSAPAPAPAPSAPANPNALTPPKLVTGAEATYPEAAKAAGKEATVDLQITLDAAGKPTDVRVVAPVGDGFDEAAVEAARRFVFEPARRGQTPIPSRIRYQYAFKLPPPPPPAPTTGAFEGKVLLRGGDDLVVGASVKLTSEDGTLTRITTTEPDGTFSFGDLPKGRYRVEVAGQDLRTVASHEEVTAGDATTVTYRLDPMAGATKKSDGEALEFGATATVEAPPREVTKRTLGAAELLNAAGTRGDPLRAIEYMPGVARAPNADFIIIRGSSPEDSEVEFEGAPVNRLYHFGGLTSFVQPRFVDHIDLYPGNFSARYGRKMGGIVDVGVRDPKSDGYHAMVDANVIDTSVLAEGPVGRRGAFAIAAKRSYIDVWFDKVMPADIGVTAAPVYYDYQLIGTYRPTDRDRLRLMIYGSEDSFKLTLANPDDTDPTVRGKVEEHSGFHRGQFLWKHKYSDAVEQEVTVTGGQLSFGQNLGPEVTLQVPGADIYGRAEWRVGLGQRARLIAGLDVAETFAKVTYFGPSVKTLDGDPSVFGPLTGAQDLALDRTLGFFRPAGYVEAILQPTDRLQLVPGARVDYFGDIGRWTFDPRLTGRYQIAPTTALKAGAGLFSQVPDYAQVLPVIGNPHLQAPRAQHYSLGVDQRVGERLTLTLEGFYKRLDRVVVDSPVPGENLNNDGIGRIYGGELSARLQPGRRTTGFVSYTLSRSERNDHGDAWRLFNWDQTHILTVASTVRLGRGWDLGGTFRYTTGNPMTPVVDATYNANTDTYHPIYGGINSARNPAFHRLDLRVEKQWKVGGGNLATYLDLQNVYNHRAQEGQVYNYNFTQSEAIPGLPVIPSVGIRGEI